MNHAGEIAPLTRMVRPHIAVITAIAASHLGHFKSLDEIADAKAEIFLGVEPGGHAVINRDSPYFDRLAAAARAAGVAHVVGFGHHPQAEVRLERAGTARDCCCITADILDETLDLQARRARRAHGAEQSRGAGGRSSLRRPIWRAPPLALATVEPAKGRGARSAGSGSRTAKCC